MLTRIEEKKIDGKRCVVVSMEIDENATLMPNWAEMSPRT
jgi:hypothetical protein